MQNKHMQNIAIGDGHNTPFWETRWLNGSSPKELAPNLFQAARYKGRSVFTELQNQNWIRNLAGINSSALLEEFTLLYMALADVQLSEHKDQILWKWTPDGKYSAASAYECQFWGSTMALAAPLWKAHAEPNVNSLPG
jgi:hypothetical protein